MELARLSGKVVLSRHHVRTANGAAKTMSGRTSKTITFLFGRIGGPRLRIIHCKTQSSNIHRGRAFIRGRSAASIWGFFLRRTLCSWEVCARLAASQARITGSRVVVRRMALFSSRKSIQSIALTVVSRGALARGSLVPYPPRSERIPLIQLYENPGERESSGSPAATGRVDGGLGLFAAGAAAESEYFEEKERSQSPAARSPACGAGQRAARPHRRGPMAIPTSGSGGTADAATALLATSERVLRAAGVG